MRECRDPASKLSGCSGGQFKGWGGGVQVGHGSFLLQLFANKLAFLQGSLWAATQEKVPDTYFPTDL